MALHGHQVTPPPPKKHIDNNYEISLLYSRMCLDSLEGGRLIQFGLVSRLERHLTYFFWWDFSIIFNCLMSHIISVVMRVCVGLILQECKWSLRCPGPPKSLFVLGEGEGCCSSCSRCINSHFDWALCFKRKLEKKMKPIAKSTHKNESRCCRKRLHCLIVLKEAFSTKGNSWRPTPYSSSLR